MSTFNWFHPASHLRFLPKYIVYTVRPEPNSFSTEIHSVTKQLKKFLVTFQMTSNFQNMLMKYNFIRKHIINKKCNCRSVIIGEIGSINIAHALIIFSSQVYLTLRLTDYFYIEKSPTCSSFCLLSYPPACRTSANEHPSKSDSLSPWSIDSITKFSMDTSKQPRSFTVEYSN